MKISLFNNSVETKPKASIVFEQYIENVKNGTWQDAVINVRKIKQVGTKAEYEEAKKKTPAVTASGVFSYRAAKSLEAHSGIIAIDIDAKDNPDGIPKDELAADAYTHALHHSIGGDGVVVYVRIDPDKHLEAFLALEEYYLNNYKVSIDPSCKDVCRLRYVSWDIDLVHNEKSKVFKQYIPAKKVAPTNRVYTQQVSDIEHIINQCQSSRIDLTANYADWVRIGLAFASEYGERGRQYFHDVSSLNSGYDAAKCDKKYDNFLRSAKGGGVGIGTFVWMASLAGLETKTQRTTFIETVAKSRRNMVGKNGGFETTEQAEAAAINYLKEMENIEGTDVQPIVAKVMQMDSTQVKNSLAGDIVKDAELYVKSLPLRFNEVLRKLEYKGEPVTDYTTNGLYIDALKALKDSQKGKSLGRELFETMINSPLVERYHPFMEFFSKYQSPNQDPKIVSDLLDCLILKGYSEEDKEFLRLLVIKWLLSIIASMHGIHSVMCLVLCSSMGKGKTKFFRELLPKELRQYYTESSLDRDKDSDLEMCENLIICDDEFAGKSKKDANKLKALLSKQHFNTRAAYARRAEKYTRYAVLCGTSNEEDVLNDLEGNRRIIPLNITNVDFAKYEKIDKTKLFVALLNLYEYDPTQFMLNAEDIARLNATTVKNEESCMELEAFTMYFGAPEDYPNYHPQFMTPTEIKVYIENASKTLKVSLKKLGAVMKKLGFEKKDKKVNRTTVYGYKVVKLMDN